MNNLDPAGSIIILLIIFATAIGIFLLMRAIMLWYWKIDTIVENQQKQILILKELLKVVGKEKEIN